MYPIPANATRIRYLESTGTQYVDTGVLGGPNIRIDVRARYDYRGASIVRAYDVVDGNAYNIFVLTGNNQTNIQGAYNKSREFDNLKVDVPFGSWFDASLSNRSLTVNGTTVSTSASTILEMSSTLYVFALNRSGTITPTGGVIVYLKIWQNGVLVRSFVPVRVGQTGYLFDLVSGQLFGNAGTGDFVLGPDTFAQGVIPTRMMVGGVTVWQKPSPLPYDAEVEYLESTGTQRIHLSMFEFGNNIEAECRFSWVSVPDTRNGAVFGCGQGLYQKNKCFALFTQKNGSLYYIDASSRIAAICGSMPAFPTGPTVATGFHTARVGLSSGFIVDGVKYSDFSTNTANPADIALAARRFQIFAYFNSNDVSQASRGYNYGKCRIAWFKATDQTGRQYDMTPVRVGSTGYLFDRVSGQLFGNAGTGDFVLGPDK